MSAHRREQARVRVSKRHCTGRAVGRHTGDDNRADIGVRGALKNARQLRIVVLLNVGMSIDEQLLAPVVLVVLALVRSLQLNAAASLHAVGTR